MPREAIPASACLTQVIASKRASSPPLIAFDDVGDGGGISAVTKSGPRRLATFGYEIALPDGHEGADRDPVPVLGQDGQDSLEVGDELSGRAQAGLPARKSEPASDGDAVDALLLSRGHDFVFRPAQKVSDRVRGPRLLIRPKP